MKAEHNRGKNRKSKGSRKSSEKTKGVTVLDQDNYYHLRSMKTIDDRCQPGTGGTKDAPTPRVFAGKATLRIGKIQVKASSKQISPDQSFKLPKLNHRKQSGLEIANC